MTSPLNNLTDTWNNGATVFTALKYNITNTASASGSKLLDLQIGGTSYFNVQFNSGSSDAQVHWGPTSGSSSSYIYSGGNGISLTIDAPTVSMAQSGTVLYQLNSAGSVFNDHISLCTGVAGGTGDVHLYRDAAAIFAQRDSTNAQTLRVYNTYTDASNYERGVFDWTTTSNVLTIGSDAAGTGTQRQVNIVGSGAGINLVSGGLKRFTFQQLSSNGVIYCDNFGLDWSNGDTIISRGGAAKVIAIGTGNGNSSGAILALSKAGAIVAGDIPSGAWAVCRDTSGATTKLIYNNAGTLMTVALT